MNARVTIGQSTVLKRFSSAAAAEAALARAKALHEAGITTPVPTRTSDLTLCFPRIHGDTATALLASKPDLLAPLVNLHRIKPPGLSLQPYDPLARIHPRLSLAPIWMTNRITQIVPRLRNEMQRLCHGDFHPAQVIRDAEGLSWLLDLDDLALGPIEADLGNLIAWLATQQGLPDMALADRQEQARRSVLLEWRAMAGGIDLHSLGDFTTLAIFRRALKQAEKGDTSLLHQVEYLI